MNDVTASVQKVQTVQHLPNDAFDLGDGQALVIVADDQTVETTAERLEDETRVDAVDTANVEMVEQSDETIAARNGTDVQSGVGGGGGRCG